MARSQSTPLLMLSILHIVHHSIRVHFYWLRPAAADAGRGGCPVQAVAALAEQRHVPAPAAAVRQEVIARAHALVHRRP